MTGPWNGFDEGVASTHEGAVAEGHKVLTPLLQTFVEHASNYADWCGANGQPEAASGVRDVLGKLGDATTNGMWHRSASGMWHAPAPPSPAQGPTAA